MTFEDIKNLVINYVFDWENTTEGKSDEEIYFWLKDLFENEDFDWISLWCIREWYDEPWIWLTYYSEKIWLLNWWYDIMIERISNTSIYWLTEHIENAVKRAKMI